ncbi:MAG: proline dehydrogenase family protein [Catenulisporales bacterium]|nr:proline dehydrogenase family protein [Catenulisporales bacterium]
MLRRTLLAAAGSGRTRALIERSPGSRQIVKRYVAGPATDDAVAVADALIEDGLLATIDHLGEDTTDSNHAILVKEAYLLLLERLAAAGLTPHAEVSVKLSSIGQSLNSDGEKIALEHAHAICEAAQRAGTTVTFDMEDHTTTDSTLKIVSELRRDYAWAGIVLQAYLRRTEADCKDFALPGSRVRLCKGAYREPESVAYQEKQEVDLSFVRCMRTLMAGEGYPMLATHDPRLIEIGGALAVRNGRSIGSYEFQMLFGVRPHEQKRLAAAGERMRVYVPYGSEWYGYLMRRLAERPANLGFFARSLISKD